MRYLLLLLMFVIGNVSAYDYTIRSDFSNWTASSGFGACHLYSQSKPCISSNNFAGVDSGNVIFSYTTQTIGATITLESAAQNSSGTYYLSLDAMVGPYNANQSTKYETLAITVYLKNQAGSTVATKTFSQNITNTSMDTYVLELGAFTGVYSLTVYISGKDGGYWNGNYGAVLEAGSVLLSDYDPTNTGPTTSTTTGTSGGITSAQSANKSSARTRSNNQSDNTVYIDQVGDNNTVTIEQDGTATNTIRGIYSSGDDAGLIQGNSNTIEMRQGATTSTDSNLIEFKIIGSSNDVLLYQDRLNTGYEDTQAGGGHTIILDLNGSTNDIDIIQRNNYSTNGGHFVDLEVTGSSNSIDLKQISDYSKDIFGKVTGSNNSVTVYQHEDSNKYLDFDLTGNGHTLDVEQTGTGAHNAEITLINGSAPSTVNLLQQGSTSQSYSLEQTCYTTGGCSTTVTQGN